MINGGQGIRKGAILITSREKRGYSHPWLGQAGERGVSRRCVEKVVDGRTWMKRLRSYASVVIVYTRTGIRIYLLKGILIDLDLSVCHPLCQPYLSAL